MNAYPVIGRAKIKPRQPDSKIPVLNYSALTLPNFFEHYSQNFLPGSAPGCELICLSVY
jgi:hypothetical protein